MPSSKTPIRWEGTVALNGSGIQPDNVPATAGGNPYTVENGGGARCREFVLTNGTTDSIQLTSSQDICVRTESGRTALLKVTSVASDGSTAEAVATVWQH